MITEIADKIIRQQKRNNPVVLFLGAGASSSAGIPTTNGLIEYIRESSRFDYISTEAEGDYFSLMNRLDPGDKKLLISEFVDKAEVNKAHLITGLLLSNGLIDYVLTTNFDSLLKKATHIFPCDVKFYDVVNYDSFVGIDLPSPSVTYLHGEYREDLQLNSEEEIEQNISLVENIISQLAAKDSTWIVVGYSGSDLVFDVLTKVRSFKQKLYWVGYKDETPLHKVTDQLISVGKKNTQLITGYDADSFFDELLQEIIKKGDFDKFDLKARVKTVLLNRDLVGPENIGYENKSHNYLIRINSDAQKWIKEFGSEFETSDTLDEVTGRTSFNFKEMLSRLFFPSIDGVLRLREFIKERDFERALEYSDELISDNPDKAIFYYYKGIALGELATKQEVPEARSQYLQRMLDSFDKAEALSSISNIELVEIDRIEAIKKAVWQSEHNRAIQLVTEEELKKIYSKPLEMAISHLNNATNLQPDSVLSWDVKAQVCYMNDNVEGAVNSMENVMELKNNKEVKDYARMAGYYSLANKSQEAISTLEKGLVQYPDNKDLTTRLADGYTNTGQTDKAISIIEALIEQEPNNPQFHLVMGTQIYKSVLKMSDTLKANSDQIFVLRQQMKQAQGEEASELRQQVSELESENAELQQEITSLTDKATEELNTVLEYRPNDDTAYNTLGIIYQNKASALFDKRNRTDDNQKAAKIDAHAKDALKQAMKYYESAAEIDPENQEYWKNLFSIYTALGMAEKAKEAKQKVEMT